MAEDGASCGRRRAGQPCVMASMVEPGLGAEVTSGGRFRRNVGAAPVTAICNVMYAGTYKAQNALGDKTS